MTTVDDLPDERCENALALLKVLGMFHGLYSISEFEEDALNEPAQDLRDCGLVTLHEEWSASENRTVVTITLKTRRQTNGQQ